MKLKDVAVPTGMVHSGATVGEAFRECVTHNVDGIPYCDDAGLIIGRFSLRHTFRELCIPHDMLDHAHVLGDAICSDSTPEIVSADLLKLEVDDYILENVATITSSSPVVKALSMMEKSNFNYIFLLDDDVYSGVITRMRIASLLLSYHKF